MQASRSRPARRASTCCRAAARALRRARRCAAARTGAWRRTARPTRSKRCCDSKVDVAVVWEPDVTRALATPAYRQAPRHRRDADKLIVDVLLAGRTVLQQDPEAIAVLLAQYFDVVRHYREQPGEARAATSRPKPRCRWRRSSRCSRAWRWAGLTDNFELWFGIKPRTPRRHGRTSIQSHVAHPDRDRRASSDPAARPGSVPHHQPPVRRRRVYLRPPPADSPAATRRGAAWLSTSSALDDAGMGSGCARVGTLKALDVGFQSGTAELELRRQDRSSTAMMDVLSHYPDFRAASCAAIPAQAATPSANHEALAATAPRPCARYLNVTYDVDPNRIRVLGLGSSQPLPRLPDESDRAYDYRLPRVEVSPAARMPFERHRRTEPPNDLLAAARSSARCSGEPAASVRGLSRRARGARRHRRGARRRLAADPGAPCRVGRRRGAAALAVELFLPPRPHRRAPTSSRLRKQMAAQREAQIADLAADLERDQGERSQLASSSASRARSRRSRALLTEQARPQEITFARFSAIAEQVFLAGARQPARDLPVR